MKQMSQYGISVLFLFTPPPSPGPIAWAGQHQIVALKISICQVSSTHINLIITVESLVLNYIIQIN